MLIKNEFLENLKRLNLNDFKKYVLDNYIVILGCNFYNQMDMEYRKKYIDVAGNLDKFITMLIIEGGY